MFLYRICLGIDADLRTKWGGLVHPSPTCYAAIYHRICDAKKYVLLSLVKTMQYSMNKKKSI